MKKEINRGVETLSWDDAIRRIENAEHVMYRASAFDEFDLVPTMSMIATLAELKCEVDLFVGKKDGYFYLSRPMAKGGVL